MTPRRAGSESVDDQEHVLDRIETGDSRVIDRYIEQLRDDEQRREVDLERRRDELLALADDPAAIRRAAISLLRRSLDDGRV